MHICCKQYNAFTPVCFGNVNCIGCCPPSCGMPGGCNLPGPICSALGPMAGGCDPQMAMGMGMPMGMPTGMPMGMPMQPGQLPVSLPGQPPMLMPPGAPMPNGMPAPPATNMPPILNHTAQYGYPAPYYGYGYGYGVQPVSYYAYPNAYAAYYGVNPYTGYAQPAYGYGYGYGAYGQQPR
jgi:hypothetical protein